MPTVIRQAAALPVRDGLVCVVTSRSRRRWVIPKGRIEVRQTPADAARVEAWEEAGLVGVLSEHPVGEYEYRKEGRVHTVAVFTLAVESEREVWPEQYERRREWVTPEAAVARLDEPELKAIVRTVTENLRAAVA
jgi:8-oxo-dGTP pyrophosphatase MutT (NUDIX family)